MFSQLISVVIPIFNVEKYLEECLNSVCQQSYKNLEIICVDDGSTDKSSSIMDEYAQKDKRFVIIHKKNEGYGKAVNIGINTAKGKYIAILEPDDYIVPYMYESLINTAEKTNADFVKSNFYEFRGEENNRIYIYRQTLQNLDIYDRIFTPNENYHSFIGFISNWTGLYNREFLIKNDICHNETPGASYQDVGFNFLVNTYAKKAYYMHEPFYHYRCDNPNASVLRKDKVYCVRDEFNFIKEKLEKNKSFCSKTVENFLVYKLIHYLVNLLRIDDNFRTEFMQHFSSEIKKLTDKEQLNYNVFERVGEVFKIRQFLLDPQKFIEIQKNPMINCQNSTNLNYEIIKNFEKIRIYGAGKIALDFYDKINEKMREKIKSFLVTEIDNDYGNLPKPVEKFNPNLIEKDELIIVCVSKKIQIQIDKILNENKIKNYLYIQDLYF
ncbi:MAG: glycosyltransferase family 2 protein [Treponemataceae bacterium]